MSYPVQLTSQDRHSQCSHLYLRLKLVSCSALISEHRIPAGQPSAFGTMPTLIEVTTRCDPILGNLRHRKWRAKILENLVSLQIHRSQESGGIVEGKRWLRRLVKMPKREAARFKAHPTLFVNLWGPMVAMFADLSGFVVSIIL